MDDDGAHVPVTFEFRHRGPFYHGTKPTWQAICLSGYGQLQDGRVSKNIYFSATLDAAVWGAELARGEGAGRVYIVEPTGPFEDDPNLTNKRFPGNPTRSYRTREPLRVAREVKVWVGHAPQVLQAMLDHLAELERQGLAAIDD
jgi:rifampin ADP-ribosylating transferase